MKAEMTRDLFYLIETDLAELTIENLKRVGDIRIPMRENLTHALLLVVPELCKRFDTWSIGKYEWEREQAEQDMMDSTNSE